MASKARVKLKLSRPGAGSIRLGGGKMLGRLVLLLVQIVVGWFGANYIMHLIHVPGAFELYVFAIVAAIIVFLLGILAAQVLRGVGHPGSATLTWTLIGALIAAALASFGPEYAPQIPWGRVPKEYIVLAGSIIGYLI
jgi:hypothetical protein